MVGRIRRTAGAALIVAALSTGSALAAVPQFLTEQGQLVDQNGVPVPGSISITFAIYGAPTGGTALWSEGQSVTLDDGFFSAVLGETTAIPANIFTGAPLYLGVTVGTDPEMTPRQAILSVPYAIVAGNAVGDITPTSAVDQWRRRSSTTRARGSARRPGSWDRREPPERSARSERRARWVAPERRAQAEA